MRSTILRLNLHIALILIGALGVSQARAADPLPDIPFLEAWAKSPHADAKSESFRHWDKDGKVPKNCAKCHSGDGFRDFIGADGSAPGIIDVEPGVNSVIACTTCHNDAALKLDAVVFPSGISIANTGRNTRCMTCHQGRQSGSMVDASVEGLPLDRTSDKLKFLNVHYRAAASTVWGSLTKIGYEYTGAAYHGRYEHTSKLNECVDCHDPHSLEVKVSACVQCHEGAVDAKSLTGIRRSKADYDGDGDVTEGISGELTTLQDQLISAIQIYAERVAKKAIAYDSHAYPYFFYDTNKNGKADTDEAVYKNQYNSWTPRLLKAAYNYQFALKDTGAYAHNPYYVLQLLHDSLSDLSGPTKTSMKGLVRP